METNFPSSRLYLCVGGIVVSEHVLRRTAKLCTHSDGSTFDCFLLGNIDVGTDVLSINVDRVDQGKEVISDGKIIKAPTLLIPGDVIIPTKVLVEEDVITFTADQYTAAFNELENLLRLESPFADLLQIKCIISLLPEDDLGAPMKVTCEMVYPGFGFELKPITPLPLASTPVTRALSGDLAGVTKQGFLTLDRTRRGVLILNSDTTALSESLLVGTWMSLPLSHPLNTDPSYPLGPAVWRQLSCYIFKQNINRESPVSSPFLLCILSGGSVSTWECSISTASTVFKHAKCTKYVVVPESQVTADTTTFQVEDVAMETDSHVMFTSALRSARENIWDKSDDIEPRSAPCATPTAPTAKPAPIKRSISPLSILAPTGSMLVSSDSLLAPSDSLVLEADSKEEGEIECSQIEKTQEKMSEEKSQDSRDDAEIASHLPNGHPPLLHKHPGNVSLDPTYPPNTFLSPSSSFPTSPYDPRLLYRPPHGPGIPPPHGMGVVPPPPPPPGSEVGDHYAHSRQNSDPYSAGGMPSPMSPYFYNPYFDHMRYQYPAYPGYPPHLYPPNGVPHNVPAFYPPNYSPVRRSKKPSKEKSAFRAPGTAQTSPSKRTNHRSPEKSSFSSANKSGCSTSTLSSRDSTQNSSRSKRGGGASSSKSKKTLYTEEDVNTGPQTPRSIKSSASSSVSDRRKNNNCTRDSLNKSGRSSRTTSSQSESASISTKALKMLTLQKRQLDHLQQQVSLLMKNAHTTTTQPNNTNVASLDKSIETMRNQMEILEQEIDKDVTSTTKTNDMCVGTGESLILSSNNHIADQSVQCDQSFQCDSTTTDYQPIGPRSEAQSSRVSEKSVAQCSATVENSDDDSGSFYLRFKENEDPQRPNGWDSSDTFTKYVSPTREPMKYQDRSIFQHPKIHAPTLSHSIYNSMYFEEEDDNLEETVPLQRSPEKPHYSIASRKYLEKHRLVSPPTKDVDKKKGGEERRGGEKIICRNGKIMQLRNGERNSGSETESFDVQRLQI